MGTGNMYITAEFRGSTEDAAAFAETHGLRCRYRAMEEVKPTARGTVILHTSVTSRKAQEMAVNKFRDLYNAGAPIEDGSIRIYDKLADAYGIAGSPRRRYRKSKHVQAIKRRLEAYVAPQKTFGEEMIDPAFEAVQKRIREVAEVRNDFAQMMQALELANEFSEKIKERLGL